MNGLFYLGCSLLENSMIFWSSLTASSPPGKVWKLSQVSLKKVFWRVWRCTHSELQTLSQKLLACDLLLWCVFCDNIVICCYDEICFVTDLITAVDRQVACRDTPPGAAHLCSDWLDGMRCWVERCDWSELLQYQIKLGTRVWNWHPRWPC